MSVADPALAEFFGIGQSNAGVPVNETTALALSAVFRAVSIISGTIASLPMPTIRTLNNGTREVTGSFLDNPAGPGSLTPFEWKELALIHLLLHGNAYLLHIYNGAGALAGLWPVHPLAVSITLDFVRRPLDGKVFTVTLDDGTTRQFTSDDLTHVPALSTDGRQGLSPMAIARNSLGTAIAGDRSAARMFANGALITGIVTPEEDITEAEATVIKDGLRAKMLGTENAGDIAVINRKLKFTPWSLSAEDAQFIQSRQFQIEEIARWYGVPPHLLMQTEKQTSWGTGIAEQNAGLARYSLMPWTIRLEQRLTLLLTGRRVVEFDFTGLERPSPVDEINLLIQQVDAGLMTVNEARRIRHLPPVDGGDDLRDPTTQPAAGRQTVGNLP